MGDNPFRAFADPQLEYRPHLHSPAAPLSQSLPQSLAQTHNQLPHAINGAAGTSEEEGVIKCICGFQEDDGETVLCELCNTWQHIACFYASPDDVPDVHKCTECWPRALDITIPVVTKPRIKQSQATDPNHDDRKLKRPGPKPHRKSKTKDSFHSSLVTNGWSSNDHFTQDRASRSPHEQGPPAKKPKTSHKHHGSVATTSISSTTPQLFSSSHHRTLSNADAAMTLPLADCPPEYFSPEFIRVHQENTAFTPAHANLHLDMTVTNSLSNWLDDPEEFAKVTGGQTHDEVFQHLPQQIEELECPVKKHIYRDTSVQFHGGHPSWPCLTVERDLYAGDLVGEVRGSIGHREDYKNDLANRWRELHHPDHFVFFHPALPIYIDCRTEGNNLRYVRRSCRPNIRLDTIITGAREYRFCFTALTDIARGSEITIGWDTGHDPQLQECLSHSIGSAVMLEQEKQYVTHWVETILAHFGGCACEKNTEHMCWMAYFDRRLDNLSSDTAPRPAKKRRRTIKNASPNAIQMNNSRESSEAVAAHELHRSHTHSPRGRNSRDVTPGNNHNPDDGNDGVDALSARDRKKLMQQEHLFSKLDNPANGTKRKKRVSNPTYTTSATAGTTFPVCIAGSKSEKPYVALLTPLKKTLNHSGSSNASNSNTPVPQTRSPPLCVDPALHPDGAFELGETQAKRSRQPSAWLSNHSSKVTYMDSSAQTHEMDPRPTTRCNPTRRPCVSLSQRLLRKSLARQLRDAARSDVQPTKDSVSAGVPNTASARASPPSPGVPCLEGPHVSMLSGPSHANVDAEMEDAERSPRDASRDGLATSAVGELADSTMSEITFPETPQPSAKPPEFPKQNIKASAVAQTFSSLAGRRSAGLHVDLPRPPLFSESSTADRPRPILTGPLTSSTVESPLPITSGTVLPTTNFIPPQHAMNGSIVPPTPSPAKKKMSLSDYMNKRKSETPASEKSLGQTQHMFGPSSSVAFGEVTASNIASSDGQEDPPKMADARKMNKLERDGRTNADS